MARSEAYKNFRFRLKWDGRYIAGISKVSGLKRTTEVVEHREGGSSGTIHKLPGPTTYPPITIERHLSGDDTFRNWAGLISGAESNTTEPAPFRKDVIIELVNIENEILAAYSILNCWISEYQALPELDAEATDTAIESITLQNEGGKQIR